MYYASGMKKTGVISIILFCLIVTSCASSRKTENYNKYAFNGVALNDSLFCDQTEVSNFSWLEYMYWNGRVFGEESVEYAATIPDSNVWETLSCNLGFQFDFYKHHAYRQYPVVGITKEQALQFSRWRSDRVFEAYLIDKGRIRLNPNQNASNYFSIENYFNGSYCDKQDRDGDTIGTPVLPDFDLSYPAYRLPDQNDRNIILDYVDSTDFRFHRKRANKYEKWRKNNLPFHLAISICPNTPERADFPYRTTNTGLDSKNRFKLIHDSRGNVAEWGAESNITYGGGWPHNVEYVLENDTISSENANAWTGFRNVWAWKKWETEPVTPK